MSAKRTRKRPARKNKRLTRKQHGGGDESLDQFILAETTKNQTFRMFAELRLKNIETNLHKINEFLRDKNPEYDYVYINMIP